jgi:hypothetical protein
LVGEEEMITERVRLMRRIQSLSKDSLRKVEDFVTLVKKAEEPPRRDDRS